MFGVCLDILDRVLLLPRIPCRRTSEAIFLGTRLSSVRHRHFFLLMFSDSAQANLWNVFLCQITELWSDWCNCGAWTDPWIW